METLIDLPVQVGMVLENYSITTDGEDGTFLHNTLDAEQGDPTDTLHIHVAALRPIGEVLIARADALIDPVIVRFPTPDPLQTIADTLEAHVEAGERLSLSQMSALAATLRSIQRRVEPAAAPGCVVVPIRKMVPGSPVSQHIAFVNNSKSGSDH